ADTRHHRFMTLALLQIDGRAATVRWASAGHDPAIVYRPDGDTFVELEGGDVPLGMLEGIEYLEYNAGPFSPGTGLIIGTDGVWEMFNPEHQQYGKERLRDVIRRHHTAPSKEIAAALEADLAAFRSTSQSVDDVTFVIVKFLAA